METPKLDRTPIADWKKINGLTTHAQLDFELKRVHLKERLALREFRSYYSGALFLLTIIWIFIVLLILIFNKKGTYYWQPINLSDKVLITLISTTTVNVFAFFVLVVEYMFAISIDKSKKPPFPKIKVVKKEEEPDEDEEDDETEEKDDE